MSTSLFAFDDYPVPEPLWYDKFWIPKKCTNQKEKNHYIFQIGQYRSNLRHAIQTSTTSDHKIKAAEAFLALLVDLSVQAKDNDKISRNDCYFQWRPCLNADLSEFMQCSAFEMDLSMAFITLAAMYSNSACDEIAKTDVELETKISHAAQRLRQAAGIIDYLLINVTEKWTALPKGRPTETVKPVLQALKLIFLAEAEQLAIVKGLNSGQTSVSVLIKLLRHVSEQYEQADTLLASLSPFDTKLLTPEVRLFVQTQIILTRAHTCKYLAETAYKEERYGEAVGYLKKATDSLNIFNSGDVGEGFGLVNLQNLARAEHEKIKEQYRIYKHENDTIYFSPVTPEAELKYPQPKQLFSSIEFTLPALPVSRVDLRAS
eukprot:c15449_g1_i2.p1 GENE.c15449_g1_i2~~c15449_g1_i2.p1  ORF type:complete len:382 (+),score=112.35 c15449_g1_i2:24-1148(+)